VLALGDLEARGNDEPRRRPSGPDGILVELLKIEIEKKKISKGRKEKRLLLIIERDK